VFVTKLAPAGSALVYSTYLGGGGEDVAYGIAVDGTGSAYITGYTDSANFPTQSPYQGLFQGGTYNAFVTKLTPAGNALVYSTYLGGAGDDEAFAIALDAAGSAYIAGFTSSTNFPVLSPYQATAPGGPFDVFVTKLVPAGNALVYSTYLGGNNEDYGLGIAVDGAGSAYVTGFTNSTNFPAVSPYQAAFNGRSYNAFVAKFTPAGSALVYSTYLGGSSDDEAYGIAVDSAGSAYITGLTNSTNFPTQPAYQATYQGGAYDAFVTKLAVPALSVTHTGNFTQGQTGAAYTVTVSNPTPATASGAVAVTETLPSGLRLVSMAGAGWACAANTCARSDTLGAGASYTPITVTVNVAANAPSPLVNTVTLSRTGSTGASATDSTTVNPLLVLNASPATASFVYTFGCQNNSLSQALSITSSSGSAPLTATVTGAGSWLTATLNNSSPPSTLILAVNPAGLSGHYSSNVAVSSQGLVTLNIPVSFTTVIPPAWTTNPSSLAFGFTSGGSVTPVCKVVSVPRGACATTEVLTLAANTSPSDAAWLTDSQDSSTLPANVTVCANPAGLSVGTHNGSIAFTAPPETGPVMLPVAMQLSPQPTLTPSPATVNYSYTIGSPAPAPAAPAGITSNPTGATGLTLSATGNCSWLNAYLTGPVASTTLNVPINVSRLAAGSYSCTATVNGTGGPQPAPATPASVTVNLTVSPQPVITPVPAAVGFSSAAGAPPPPQQVLSVSTINPAGQNVMAAATSTPAGWLSVAPNHSATTFTVSAAPGTLGVGTYSGNIAVTLANAATVNVPVTLSIITPQLINASPASASFSYTISGNPPLGQSVLVSTTPAGGVITVTPASTGNWLGASLTGNTLTVSANPAGLAAGIYTGSITLSSPNAANVAVPVTLTVAGQPTVAVSAASAGFAYTISGPNPPSQKFNITSNPAGLAASASSCGVDWLGVTVNPANTPSNLLLTASPGGLAAGTYTCNVHISVPGALPATVSVTLTVVSPAVTVTPSKGLTFSGSGFQTLTFATNGGTPAITLSGAPPSWLTVTISGLTATVTASTVGLTPGQTYSTTLAFAASPANSPIPVRRRK